MRVLYYDCFCGISGDMNLGALIDLGVDKEYLRGELCKLSLDAEYELVISKAMKKGINGTKVDIVLKQQESNKQRHLKDIEAIINNSNLEDKVKKLSLDIFLRVAQAEAVIHGKSIAEVHFHEVGAIDSIIDIVGAAIALNYLKVDKIMASPVQVGGGFVKCAHGLIPVPAPATIEILKDIPIKSGLVSCETTTPTGAAILAANVESFTDKLQFTVEKIGYGLGTRDLEVPNVLRLYLGKEEGVEEGNEERSEEIEIQCLLETNIDDMNPELYSYVEEELFEKGALDVFKTSILMKKGRPATKLSILIDEKNEKDILDVIFRETTSIGIRKYKVEKIMLNREFLQVKTQYGDVTVKNAYYKGQLVKYKPEFEDCKKLAKENNISIAKVYREVQKMIDENLKDDE